MSTEIEFEDVRVGDLIRVTRDFGEKEIATWTGKVIEKDALRFRTREFTLYGADAVIYYLNLIERPAPPEPTKIGTVVQFEDEMEGLTKKAVLSATPRQAIALWWDWAEGDWWSWQAMKNPVVLHEGWGGDGEG